MSSIKTYMRNGELKNEYELTNDNLKNTAGMISKVTLIDGSIHVGFSDPLRVEEKDSFDNEVHDYINLWTWKNIDEELHELIGDDNDKYDVNIERINIDEIYTVESILYSHPRWGGKLTNKFEFYSKKEDESDLDLDMPDWLKDRIKDE